MVKLIKPDKSHSYLTIRPESSRETLIDIDNLLIEDSYKKYGAILFRGFKLDLNDFRNLTNSFCTHSVANFSPGRETVDKTNKIQTVDPGTDPFPLHPEMSRLPWKPDVCFFGCLFAPLKGGETVFCDGVKLVSNLPSRILKQINRQNLRYSHQISDSELKYWLKSKIVSDQIMKNPPKDCPFEFSWYKNRIFRSYVTPFLHKPMFNDRLAFGNYLLFARYIHNDVWFPVYEDGSIVPNKLVEIIKKTGDKTSDSLQWKVGDVMMIDNTRFLHGRNRILNLKERRILTYFGFLHFACTKKDPVPEARWRNPDWQPDF